MKYVKLQNTGLEISKICVGCMNLGAKDKYPWHLDKQEGIEYIKHALDSGINFFDTANVYSQGESEEILGEAIKQYGNRDELVIATKVFYPVDNSLNGRGLSRKHIFQAVEDSLRRLQLDYIDLYIIHRFDYNTPLEETMAALNDLVRMGKVRYIGASAMYAWQFQKAQYIAMKNGWSKFVSMQNHYNLLYREDERELIPLCKDMNIPLTPYSPLAGGRLTRDWNGDTLRDKYDQTVKEKYDMSKTIDYPIVKRVGEIAESKQISRAQVAMSWLLQKDNVVPIVGGTKVKHLDEAISALDVTLSDEEIEYLEELYQPHNIVGAL
ncbi:aldo/keto reductase [Thomasclavelia sp.]|uniref:aldo/keto reductase n=1 Tax=Thomasclavelia sp. TaxID=3025757 RepID=UPI0025ED9641|nr:aldo/keto reductase [Thomasclavelia sp.]